MQVIEIHNQVELDNLPESFVEYTQILIMTPANEKLIIRKARGNSSVVAKGKLLSGG